MKLNVAIICLFALCGAVLSSPSSLLANYGPQEAFPLHRPPITSEKQSSIFPQMTWVLVALACLLGESRALKVLGLGVLFSSVGMLVQAVTVSETITVPFPTPSGLLPEGRISENFTTATTCYFAGFTTETADRSKTYINSTQYCLDGTSEVTFTYTCAAGNLTLYAQGVFTNTSGQERYVYVGVATVGCDTASGRSIVILEVDKANPSTPAKAEFTEPNLIPTSVVYSASSSKYFIALSDPATSNPATSTILVVDGFSNTPTVQSVSISECAKVIYRKGLADTFVGTCITSSSKKIGLLSNYSTGTAQNSMLDITADDSFDCYHAAETDTEIVVLGKSTSNIGETKIAYWKVAKADPSTVIFKKKFTCTADTCEPRFIMMDYNSVIIASKDTNGTTPKVGLTYSFYDNKSASLANGDNYTVISEISDVGGMIFNSSKPLMLIGPSSDASLSVINVGCAPGTGYNSTSRLCDMCGYGKYQDAFATDATCRDCSGDNIANYSTKAAGVSAACSVCNSAKTYFPSRDGKYCLYQGVFKPGDTAYTTPIYNTCGTYFNSANHSSITVECKLIYRKECCNGSQMNNFDCNQMLGLNSSDTLYNYYCDACEFKDRSKCPADGLCWYNSTWTSNDDEPYINPIPAACEADNNVQTLCPAANRVDTDAECFRFPHTCYPIQVTAARSENNGSYFNVTFNNTLMVRNLTSNTNCGQLIDPAGGNTNIELANLTCITKDDNKTIMVIDNGLTVPITSFTLKAGSLLTKWCNDYIPTQTVTVTAATTLNETVNITSYTVSDRCQGIWLNTTFHKEYSFPIKNMSWTGLYNDTTGVPASVVTYLQDFAVNQTNFWLSPEYIFPGKEINFTVKYTNPWGTSFTSANWTVETAQNATIYCGPCQFSNRTFCSELNEICWATYQNFTDSFVNVTNSTCLTKVAPYCYPLWNASATDPQCANFATSLSFDTMKIKPNLTSATFTANGTKILLHFDNGTAGISFTKCSDFLNPAYTAMVTSDTACNVTADATIIEIPYNTSYGVLSTIGIVGGVLTHNYTYTQEKIDAKNVSVTFPDALESINITVPATISRRTQILDMTSVITKNYPWDLTMKWNITYNDTTNVEQYIIDYLNSTANTTMNMALNCTYLVANLTLNFTATLTSPWGTVTNTTKIVEITGDGKKYCGACQFENRALCTNLTGTCWADYTNATNTTVDTANTACLTEAAKICYPKWSVAVNSSECADFTPAINTTLAIIEPQLVSAEYSDMGTKLLLTFNHDIAATSFTNCSSFLNSTFADMLTNVTHCNVTTANKTIIELPFNTSYSPLRNITITGGVLKYDYTYAQPTVNETTVTVTYPNVTENLTISVPATVQRRTGLDLVSSLSYNYPWVPTVTWNITFNDTTGIDQSIIGNVSAIPSGTLNISYNCSYLVEGRTLNFTVTLTNPWGNVTSTTKIVTIQGDGKAQCGPCQFTNRTLCASLNGICWTREDNFTELAPDTSNTTCLTEASKICYPIWNANQSDSQCADFTTPINVGKVVTRPNLTAAKYSSDGTQIFLEFDAAIATTSFTNCSHFLNSTYVELLTDDTKCNISLTSNSTIEIPYNVSKGVLKTIGIMGGVIKENYTYSQATANATDMTICFPNNSTNLTVTLPQNVTARNGLAVSADMAVNYPWNASLTWTAAYNDSASINQDTLNNFTNIPADSKNLTYSCPALVAGRSLNFTATVTDPWGVQTNVTKTVEILSDGKDHCGACQLNNRTLCAQLDGSCWAKYDNYSDFNVNTTSTTCLDKAAEICYPIWNVSQTDAQCADFVPAIDPALVTKQISLISAVYSENGTKILLTFDNKTLSTSFTNCSDILISNYTDLLTNDTGCVVSSTNGSIIEIPYNTSKGVIKNIGIKGGVVKYNYTYAKATANATDVSVTYPSPNQTFVITAPSSVQRRAGLHLETNLTKNYPWDPTMTWSITYNDTTGIDPAILNSLSAAPGTLNMSFGCRVLVEGRKIVFNLEFSNPWSNTSTMTQEVEITGDGTAYCGACQLNNRTACADFDGKCWTKYDNYSDTTVNTNDTTCLTEIAKVCSPIWVANTTDIQCKDFTTAINVTEMLMKPVLQTAQYISNGTVIRLTFNHSIANNSFTKCSDFISSTYIDRVPNDTGCAFVSGTNDTIDVPYNTSKGVLATIGINSGILRNGYTYAQLAADATEVPVTFLGLDQNVNISAPATVSKRDGLTVQVTVTDNHAWDGTLVWSVSYNDTTNVTAQTLATLSSIANNTMNISLACPDLVEGCALNFTAVLISPWGNVTNMTKIVEITGDGTKYCSACQLNNRATCADLDGTCWTNYTDYNNRTINTNDTACLAKAAAACYPVWNVSQTDPQCQDFATAINVPKLFIKPALVSANYAENGTKIQLVFNNETLPTSFTKCSDFLSTTYADIVSNDTLCTISATNGSIIELPVNTSKGLLTTVGIKGGVLKYNYTYAQATSDAAEVSITFADHTENLTVSVPQSWLKRTGLTVGVNVEKNYVWEPTWTWNVTYNDSTGVGQAVLTKLGSFANNSASVSLVCPDLYVNRTLNFTATFTNPWGEITNVTQIVEIVDNGSAACGPCGFTNTATCASLNGICWADYTNYTDTVVWVENSTCIQKAIENCYPLWNVSETEPQCVDFTTVLDPAKMKLKPTLVSAKYGPNGENVLLKFSNETTVGSCSSFLNSTYIALLADGASCTMDPLDNTTIIVPFNPSKGLISTVGIIGGVLKYNYTYAQETINEASVSVTFENATQYANISAPATLKRRGGLLIETTIIKNFPWNSKIEWNITYNDTTDIAGEILANFTSIAENSTVLTFNCSALVEGRALNVTVTLTDPWGAVNSTSTIVEIEAAGQTCGPCKFDNDTFCAELDGKCWTNYTDESIKTPSLVPACLSGVAQKCYDLWSVSENDLQCKDFASALNYTQMKIAPVPLYANYSKDASNIIVTYDIPIDSTVSNCSNILSSDSQSMLTTNPICIPYASNTLVISCDADKASTVHNITLNGGVVKSAYPYAMTTANQTTLDVTFPALVAYLDTNMTSTSKACEDLTMIVYQTNAVKYYLQYKWDIAIKTPGSMTQQEQDAANALFGNFTQYSSAQTGVTITKGYLKAGTVFTVNVTGKPGELSNETVTFSKDTEVVPCEGVNLTIDATGTIVLQGDASKTIGTNINVTGTQGTVPKYTVSFAVASGAQSTSITTPEQGIASAIQSLYDSSRKFTLSRVQGFQYEKFYNVKITVATELGTSDTKSVLVSVPKPGITTAIKMDSILIPLDSNVTLDSSPSVIPEPEGDTVVYQWSCVSCNSMTKTACSCPVMDGIPLDGPTLLIPTGVLVAYAKYQFKLGMTVAPSANSEFSRTGSATTEFYTYFSAGAEATVKKTEQDYTAYFDVLFVDSFPNDVKYTWTVVGLEVPGNSKKYSTMFTFLYDFFNAQGVKLDPSIKSKDVHIPTSMIPKTVSTSSDRTLAIDITTAIPAGKYTYVVSVTNIAKPTFVAFTWDAPAIPSARSISITPTTGIASTTVFKISVSIPSNASPSARYQLMRKDCTSNELTELTFKEKGVTGYSQTFKAGKAACNGAVQVILRTIERGRISDSQPVTIIVQNSTASPQETAKQQLDNLLNVSAGNVSASTVVNTLAQVVNDTPQTNNSGELAGKVLQILDGLSGNSQLANMTDEEKATLFGAAANIMVQVFTNFGDTVDVNDTMKAATNLASLLGNISSPEQAATMVGPVLNALGAATSAVSNREDGQAAYETIHNTLDQLQAIQVAAQKVGATPLAIFTQLIQMIVQKIYMGVTMPPVTTQSGSGIAMSEGITFGTTNGRLLADTSKMTLGTSFVSVGYNPYASIKANTAINSSTLQTSPQPFDSAMIAEMYARMSKEGLKGTVDYKKLETFIVELELKAFSLDSNGTETPITGPVAMKIAEGSQLTFDFARVSTATPLDPEAIYVPLFYYNNTWLNGKCEVLLANSTSSTIKVKCSKLPEVLVKNPPAKYIMTVDAIHDPRAVASAAGIIFPIGKSGERYALIYGFMFGLILLFLFLQMHFRISDKPYYIESTVEALNNPAPVPRPNSGCVQSVFQFFARIRRLGFKRATEDRASAYVATEAGSPATLANVNARTQNEALLNGVLAKYNAANKEHGKEEAVNIIQNAVENEWIVARTAQSYMTEEISREGAGIWNVIKNLHHYLNAFVVSEMDNPRWMKASLALAVILGELFITGWFYFGIDENDYLEDSELAGKIVAYGIGSALLMIPLRLILGFFLNKPFIAEDTAAAEAKEQEKCFSLRRFVGVILTLIWTLGAMAGILAFTVLLDNRAAENWMKAFGIAVAFDFVGLGLLRILSTLGFGAIMAGAYKTCGCLGSAVEFALNYF